VAAAGFAGGLAGLGLTAAFAVGVAFLGDERRTSAFFAAFFLAAVFLRVVALVTGGFLRFALVLPLAFFLVGIWSLLQQAIVPAHFTHLKGG
jgi:hypothetical protein